MSGRVKGGKGLGEGGARRYRRVLWDNSLESSTRKPGVLSR